MLSFTLSRLFKQVHFVIGGDDDETSVRTFADPHRKILQRGGIDAFIMAVPKYINQLSFYLSSLIVVQIVGPIELSPCVA